MFQNPLFLVETSWYPFAAEGALKTIANCKRQSEKIKSHWNAGGNFQQKNVDFFSLDFFEKIDIFHRSDVIVRHARDFPSLEFHKKFRQILRIVGTSLDVAGFKAGIIRS